MSVECIYNIDLITNNKDRISVSSDYFDHFYIANIDDEGNETHYEINESTSNLYANFFMIKILNDKENNTLMTINRLIERKDIVKVGICFTNGNYQEFDVAKKRVAKNGILENVYQDVFSAMDDLCILVTDKNIKYKENLFA